MNLTYDQTSLLVQTPSWQIHTNQSGSGDQVVILLHGSGPGATGWSNFSANIPFLAERYRVIAADLPGWGASSPSTWQERDHPRAVIELMDTLGIERATFIGNSMGGGTTIRLGYEYPERVDKLVTMGASSGATATFGPGGPSEGIKALQHGYREPTPQSMRELVEVMTFDSSFATDELVQRRAEMVAAHPEHNRNFIEGIGRRPIVELDVERVRSIRAKTLLLHGRDDRVVHFEHSLRLVSLIPDSRLVMMNRCGHWLQIEHAEEFNRLVADFIDNA